jgi:signal transduction histidine kinase
MSAHRTDRSWESFTVRELVEEVVASLASRLAAQAVEVFLDVPASHRLFGDRKLLGRAVENLVINALESMPRGGSLVATSAAEPHAMELEIADTGPAMSDGERGDVFDLMPAEQRGSSGWGLAVVRRIAEMHGGRVSAANCPDSGVALTLHIPNRIALEAAA